MEFSVRQFFYFSWLQKFGEFNMNIGIGVLVCSGGDKERAGRLVRSSFYLLDDQHVFMYVIIMFINLLQLFSVFT